MFLSVCLPVSQINNVSWSEDLNKQTNNKKQKAVTVKSAGSSPEPRTHPPELSPEALSPTLKANRTSSTTLTLHLHQENESGPPEMMLTAH